MKKDIHPKYGPAVIRCAGSSSWAEPTATGTFSSGWHDIYVEYSSISGTGNNGGLGGCDAGCWQGLGEAHGMAWLGAAWRSMAMAMAWWVHEGSASHAA